MKVDVTRDHIIVRGNVDWLYVSSVDTLQLIVGFRSSKHRIVDYSELLRFSNRRVTR